MLVSPTGYALGPLLIPFNPTDEAFYKAWSLVDASEPHWWSVQSLVDANQFHKDFGPLLMLVSPTDYPIDS